MSNPRQLSLPVYLPDDETFSSFYPANNEELLGTVSKIFDDEDCHFVYLWGAPKSGKTHLLHACCAQAQALGHSTFYIPFEMYASMSDAVLEDLHNLPLICLDNIDLVAGNPLWEEALFDLYNRVKESGGKLIASATNSPNQNGFKLPDLVSRLSWGLSYQVHSMSDQDKLAAMQQRAESRGLVLADDVGKYLFNRLDRDLRTLFDTLDRLDKASMQAQRKLTIPFIKEILKL
ncbi:DnaA inactivator Hda [Psychrobium sp. 1_MG-2023]|uniref:DnaA inactivator Hda n=1 Tax=Psychrobium sp. 1_MG-2023 TaxID=3062624 RepID=UPI000C328260|nr:DnaA inactivator Hda [Psychrobium sp. 1_MG-2023]MDP2560296.1 DnaA inactivator Hda [Psychrobium sp. 1_MG-2023]PKF55412.1 DnaA regulatory inactivator Hda [Alteromonadales bacterium alter-6D02]